MVLLHFIFSEIQESDTPYTFYTSVGLLDKNIHGCVLPLILTLTKAIPRTIGLCIITRTRTLMSSLILEKCNWNYPEVHISPCQPILQPYDTTLAFQNLIIFSSTTCQGQRTH